MTKSYLKNLARNQQNVQKYHHQLSSMKEVSKPSDNPLLVSQIIGLKENVSSNQQYQSTIKDAIDWSNMQDASLGKATDSLMRISTLVQSAATDTMNASDRLIVKAEIETEIQTFVDALNTNYGGRYIFGGTETLKTPFEMSQDADGALTGIIYNGTSQNISREISPGVTVDLLTNGAGVLNDSGQSLGALFKEVVSALKNDDTKAVAATVGKVTTAIDHVVSFRTEIGAVSNRLGSALSRNESQDLNLREMLSSKEDIDFAKKYMQFSNEQVAYQASLQMGTKILNTTILDYL